MAAASMAASQATEGTKKKKKKKKKADGDATETETIKEQNTETRKSEADEDDKKSRVSKKSHKSKKSEKKDAEKKAEPPVIKISDIIMHPFAVEIERIKKEIDLLERLETPESYQKYTFEHILCLQDQATYRQKIKGFHLAFNVREPKVESSQFTNGTFKAKAWDKSAREHREKSQLLKTNRLKQ